MADFWMDVDAALAEVPVNILPLIDDTDFKSREVSVAYDQAGMDLVWNFVTTAGAMTQTAVTPTTGGAYDWAHQGDGMYSIEIPASGGGSINNDTEGFGWFTGYCTGVLSWRGPTIGFRAAALNNLLIDAAYSATRGLAGTALPDAVADAAGGLPISDAGGLDLDAILADTNELQADDIPGAISTHDGKLDTVDGIVDNILTDTAVIGALGAGLTAVPWNSAWDTEVQSEVDDALVANNLDHLAKTATAGADMTTEVVDNTILSRMLANGDTSAFVPSTDGLQLIRDKLTDIETDTNELQSDDVPGLISTHDGKLDTVDGIVDNILADTDELQGDWVNAGRLDAILDLILADTGELQTDWADAGRLDALIDLILADTGELQTDDVPTLIGALNDLTSAEVGDAVLDEAVESTETLRQLLRLMRGVLIGKSQGGGTTTPDFRDRGDTKNRVTFTTDADGNRTASTTDPS